LVFEEFHAFLAYGKKPGQKARTTKRARREKPKRVRDFSRDWYQRKEKKKTKTIINAIGWTSPVIRVPAPAATVSSPVINRGCGNKL